MRRFLMMIFIITLITACHGTPPSPIPYTPIVTAITSPATQTATLETPADTITPQPSPTQSSTFTPSPAASATLPSLSQPFSVIYHPDAELYVGDQVSFEVVSPPGMDLKNSNLEVQVDPPSGIKVGPSAFGPWGIQGREESTLLWAWDTRSAQAGTHTLSYSVQPGGYHWTEQVTLLPASEMPPAQASAHWAETRTQCCTVFYVTGTASERDLNTLTSLIDEQGSKAMDEMDASFTQPITITVLPRLLGHGGFTSSEISVSYLDRNYAANDWALVVHHEMIHEIDGHLGGDFRPTIFVEGLAVYETGGHYKPEPLMPRAAALLPGYLDRYIPLKTLADDFYASQHEIGYLEGASLIEYMVKTWGWEAFSAFYRDIHNQKNESQSDSIDAALKAHFSTSFPQLEKEFIAALSLEPDTSAWVDDVRLTVTFYDTMRRYQQLLDPSAYFRTAWLLDNKTMRQRGIVADYLRHPHTAANLALETLFITAHQQFTAKYYPDATLTLAMITSVLNGIEHDRDDPFSVSLLTADYLSISSTLLQRGYEVQDIALTFPSRDVGSNGDTAVVHATLPAGPDLIELHLVRSGGQWSIQP